jgi:hypothetical protein
VEGLPVLTICKGIGPRLPANLGRFKGFITLIQFQPLARLYIFAPVEERPFYQL